MPVQNPIHPNIPQHDGERQRWDGLHGCSRGLAIAAAINAHDGPVIAITADTTNAQVLEEEVRFFLGQHSVPIKQFPDWETLPYDTFSPHQTIVSERLAALSGLFTPDSSLLVSPISTLMSRLSPPSFIEAHSLALHKEERIDMESLRLRFERAGYRAVSQVMEHGEFAIRGSLIDIYPMGTPKPFRIDQLDEEIESIRRFDPETQRTIDKVDEIDLLPAREFPLNEASIKKFRGQWRSRFEGEPQKSSVYQGISEGLVPAGIEYYLPLFFDQTATFFDYLPSNALIIYTEDASLGAERFWQEIEERHEARRHDIERPLLSPGEIYLRPDEVFSALHSYRRILLNINEGKSTSVLGTRPSPSLPINAQADDPLHLMRKFLDNFNGRGLVLAETPGRQEILFETLRSYQIKMEKVQTWEDFLCGNQPLGLTIAPLTEGTLLNEPAIAIITEQQLFGQRINQHQRRRTQRNAENVVRDLTELQLGAPIVHELHGIGRYLGLQTLDIDGAVTEFVALEYADGDKLYVPVLSLHLISRYVGADLGSAPLHKLGGQQWQKTKAKAARKACDVAAELLAIHAQRAVRQGHSHSFPNDSYQVFVQDFPFAETPDQQITIDAVLEDMASPRPMDRLVCGDVGFGKTEVAMRAAFAATMAGRQVAVLVPTTLLAQQHQQTFSDRFANWPVHIEQLSRFRTKKERDTLVHALNEGKVDIVIGTHRLLQDDIRFKRLGLVIIDEEHRFGVRHKEKLKALRAEVDLLALTATPIPRTLNMALADLRDLSLIATPPERRLPIRTFVREWDRELLREICLRELRRGGQIYFVHNRVEDIEIIADRVEKLVPEAKIQIGHGQMRERELEQITLDFYHQRFNILVCTTIIENGIDIPNANTIIIHQADRFGLAQLYQLRGRVGRSHHQAYAYLIIPHRKALSADAEKRLDVLESFDELGVGFNLATYDLEIRGAGELLGEGQSGQMREVGYALYTALLERAVNALKNGKDPELDRPLDHGPEIDLHIPAIIPEDYLPDVHHRLLLYKRIANAQDNTVLEDLRAEMIDRFGLLPTSAQNLFNITKLKLRAAPMGITKIDLAASGGRIVFTESPNIDPTLIIQLIQTQPQLYRLEGGDKLRIMIPSTSITERFAVLESLFDALSIRNAA